LTINVKKQGDTDTQIAICNEMTIYTALEQTNALSPHLKAEQTLQLDLSDVSEIDSAGIQLLIYMKREASRLNKQFSLVNHSQAVVDVMELLGLVSFFGDPIIISSNGNES